MRQSRIDTLKLKARTVGLTVMYLEKPRRASRTKTSEQRRPKPMFCFYLNTQTEGAPIFTAWNTKLADAFIHGYAEARRRAIEGERRGLRADRLFSTGLAGDAPL